MSSSDFKLGCVSANLQSESSRNLYAPLKHNCSINGQLSAIYNNDVSVNCDANDDNNDGNDAVTPMLAIATILVMAAMAMLTMLAMAVMATVVMVAKCRQ